MSVSISGSNSISGLSGMDTNFDDVLEKLYKIERSNVDRLEAWKSDWQLRYDAFSSIIDQVSAAQSVLSSISSKNKFVSKLAVSSNENVVTAVASASAQDVQHTFTVSQMASNSIWANTGHVFSSKQDLINTSGSEQYFNYSYAGKDYKFKVPANTTLDSFVSMINNSASNPGITVSLVQTANGYVFQVAGKSSGVENDLIIHDSNLVGMSSVDSTSNWRTNNAIDLSTIKTNPTSYTFDIVMDNGAKKTLTVSGDTASQELVDRINSIAGGIHASFDSSGNLQIDGVSSFSMRKTADTPYTPASTTFSIKGNMVDGNGNGIKLNATDGFANGFADDDIINFTVTMDDGNTREVQVKAGSTKRDLFVALAQATQSSNDIKTEYSAEVGWGINLAGVQDITWSGTASTGGYTLDDDQITLKQVAASGEKNTFDGQLTATTTIKFNDMSAQIDAKATPGSGADLVYTIIDNQGRAYNLTGLTSDMSNDDLVTALKNKIDDLKTSDPNIDIDYDFDPSSDTLTLKNIQSFKHTQGGISSPTYTTTLTSSITIDGSVDSNNLFKHTDGDSKKYLESPPDIVYTVTLNDGRVGTLTLSSGKSMKEVLSQMQDPSNSTWEWHDENGDPATPPTASEWNVSFTDADGVEFTDDLDVLESLGQTVYVNFANIQKASGPGIIGQVESSSNWSIQRAANALYNIDNWPLQMESASNQISDVIEGVVFTIQDVGEARLSISTDITSVEQSIQTFLDAVNSVLYTVNDLMKYDTDKETTTNDPNDKDKGNYSASGLTNQKGNLLTGNYGVQLFKTRFQNLLGSNPPGFKNKVNANDVLSGDILASLANMGIKTDTDATSSTYGLLVIAPDSSIAAMQDLDKANYEDMINNHLEAVVDFFCATDMGSSTSTDFRYDSHVNGITEPGSYEVRYTVTADGKITNVTVGGEPATQDFSQPGNYFSVSTGDPRGLSFIIDDLTVGDHPPAGEASQYITIKQGLIPTVNNWLKSELVYHDVNISATDTPEQIEAALSIKSENGALMSLRDNYQKVMQNIDTKIAREEQRLDTWYNRQKKIFANLETILNQYSETQTQLESQLKQLSND